MQARTSDDVQAALDALGLDIQVQLFETSTATSQEAADSIGTSLGSIARLAQNREGSIEGTLRSKTFKAIYSAKRLKDYRDRLSCPVAEQLVKETVGFSHGVLFGTKEDMDDIVDGIQKVYENRKALITAA